MTYRYCLIRLNISIKYNEFASTDLYNHIFQSFYQINAFRSTFNLGLKSVKVSLGSN